MPNTREKLIELLAQVQDQGKKRRGYGTFCFGNEKVADYLIANGVTVQKWIPVTERLPVEAGKYLTVAKSVLGDGDTYIRLLWYGYNFHYSDPDIGDVQMNKYVTHWMPLPEPPKGE